MPVRLALGVLVAEEVKDPADLDAEGVVVSVRLLEYVKVPELEPELVTVADTVDDRELVPERVLLYAPEVDDVSVRVRVPEPDAV